MAKEKKTLLIVDDTEIDRITLKSILCKEYNVLEAKSGQMACKSIEAEKGRLDGILLDISMPDVDGFGVLKFMEDRGVEDIPVFLVTAEPTVDNVQRAMRHHIAEFIGKPFQRDEVLKRLKAWLDITLEPSLKPEELEAVWAYISELEKVYNAYLSNHGRNDVRCRIVSDLVRILLTSYNRNQRQHRLSEIGVELVSRAAYLCDIGEMLVPCQWFQPMMGDARYQEVQREHTLLGASLVRLNHDRRCGYFVDLCADICQHHHERFDGRGYPDKLRKGDVSAYSQICHLACEFETARNGAYDGKDQTLSAFIGWVADNSEGMVSPGLRAVLKGCEPQIIEYFRKIYQNV